MTNSNYTFSHYAFNTFLNDLSIAIYDSETGGKAEVEKDGEKVAGTSTICFSLEDLEDGRDSALVDRFVSNKSDLHYNKTRALVQVIEGMTNDF